MERRGGGGAGDGKEEEQLHNHQFCHASDFIRRVRILIFVLHRLPGYLVGSGLEIKNAPGKSVAVGARTK